MAGLILSGCGNSSSADTSPAPSETQSQTAEPSSETLTQPIDESPETPTTQAGEESPETSTQTPTDTTQESPQLRPQFTVGTTYRQQLHLISDMTLPLGIPNADHKDSRLTVDCLPTAVDGQGNTLVEVTIVSLQASMISLSVQASYDSENPPADLTRLDNRGRHFYDLFDGLVGLKYTAVVDTHGFVVELRDIPTRVSQAMEGQIEGSIGEDQLIMLFSRQNLEDVVSPDFFDGLGEIAEATDSHPELNATWQSQQFVIVPRAIPVAGDQNFVLENYEISDDGSTTATISYRTVADQERAAQANAEGHSGGLEIVQAAIVGHTSYSLTEGHPIATSEDMRAEIRTTQTGRRQSENRNRIFYDVKRRVNWIEITNSN
ncbi:MAG: hypothetical protein JW936_06590 [Sedimentisphaerales bacterium]|nr:hypothetical protein [Sedimentisphaerales bacterium]